MGYVCRCAAVVGCLFGRAGLGERAAPIVPGYEQLQSAGNAIDPVEKGQLLLGELNCTACHASPSPRIESKGTPDLNGAARASHRNISAFLSDPHGTKAGTTMPDLLRGVDPATLRQGRGRADAFSGFSGRPHGAVGGVAGSGDGRAGGKLFHRVGCVACHAPEGNVETKIPSVPLGPLAMKTTVEKA